MIGFVPSPLSLFLLTFRTKLPLYIAVIFEGDEVVMMNGEYIRNTDILIEDVMEILECMITIFIFDFVLGVDLFQ